MSKHEQCDQGHTTSSGLDALYGRAVTYNRFNPDPSLSEEEKDRLSEASKVINRLWNLAQDERIWDLSGNVPHVVLSRCPAVAEAILNDARRESRQLTKKEEGVLTCICHVTGRIRPESGLGNLLAAFGERHREGQAEAYIEEMRDAPINPEYAAALRALAPKLRPPQTSS